MYLTFMIFFFLYFFMPRPPDFPTLIQSILIDIANRSRIILNPRRKKGKAVAKIKCQWQLLDERVFYNNDYL